MEISQKETFLISSCFRAGTSYINTKKVRVFSSLMLASEIYLDKYAKTEYAMGRKVNAMPWGPIKFEDLYYVKFGTGLSYNISDGIEVFAFPSIRANIPKYIVDDRYTYGNQEIHNSFSISRKTISYGLSIGFKYDL